MNIDLTQYVAGGYFIVKSVPWLEWMAADLLPERIISLSGCICPSAQVTWGWHKEGQDEARQFGVPESKLSMLRDWLTLGDRVHFPNVFYSLDAAQDFVAEFVASADNLHIIGIAVPHDIVDIFLQSNPQIVYNSTDGKYEEAKYGIHELLGVGNSPLPGGEILGFEVLSFHIQLGHSWLCSGLERDMHQLFGIRPNEHGLIATYDEAMKVYEWIAEDEQRGHRAEPEPYYPWLLVEYPLDDSLPYETLDEP